MVRARRGPLVDEDELAAVLALPGALPPDLVPLLEHLAGLDQVAHRPGSHLLEHGQAHCDAEDPNFALDAIDHAKVVQGFRNCNLAIQDVVVEGPCQRRHNNRTDTAGDQADHGDHQLLSEQAASVGVKHLLPAPQLRRATLEQGDLLGIVLNPGQNKVDVRMRLEHAVSQWHCGSAGIAHDDPHEGQGHHRIEEEERAVLKQQVHLDE
mmetsp:Transcript_92959/g.277438  ORF Transcript_92959/g.277438 Transcript_92959/m.277438 type:complete len:209 (+) Transcript_92959:3072-3698(+)